MVLPCLAQTTFPKFLTYPFIEKSVGIYNGWYYKVDGSGHYGIDYQLNEVDVVSSADGVVETVVDNMSNNFNQQNISPSDKYGNRVIVSHSNGYKTLYGHLKTGTILVRVGDSVIRGQKLAISGNTGWSNAPHLHFEVRGPQSDIATLSYGLYKYDPYGIYKKDVSLYTSNSMDDSKRLWTTNPPSYYYMVLVHPHGSILRTASNPDLYLIENGQKRKFQSFSVWQSNGQPDNLVLYVSQEELNGYVTGKEIAYPDNAYGSNFLRDPGDQLLKVYGQGSTVWLFDSSQGKKRKFILNQVYNSWKYSGSIPTLLPTKYPADQPTGEQVYFRDGTLIKGSAATIYVISQGYARPFESQQVFDALGYKTGNIISLPQTNIDQKSGFKGNGEMLTSTNIWQSGEYQVIITASLYPPQNLTASAVSSSQINLSWNANANNPASGVGYKVYYANGTLIGTTSSLNYAVTGLLPSTAYSFQVSSTYNGDESAKSNTISATTPSTPSYSIYQTIEAETMNGGVAVTGGKKLERGGNYWYLTKLQYFSQAGKVQAEVIARSESQTGGAILTKLQGFEALVQTVASTAYQSYYFEHTGIVVIDDYVELNLVSGPAVIIDKIILRYLPAPPPATPNILTIRFYAAKDTYYGTYYAKDGRPNNEELAIGGWGDWYYSYIEWDLTNAPSADQTIKAEACFTVKGVAPNDPQHKLCRVTSSWTEASVTYANYPGYTTTESADMPNTGLSHVGDIERGDITAIYQKWMNGAYPNYGLKIHSCYNNHSNSSYYSSDYSNSSYSPYIEVIYIVSGSSPKVSPQELAAGNIAESFSLFQNYPHPFNPMTTINFALPKASDVKLVVYDLLGREVERLVDGQLIVGEHSAIWNAQYVPAGIYFYQIRAGTFMKTKKMTLIK
ncbi:hypothetical protein A3B87_01430 [Candidatus Kuenenbacteria bacterium RIFCSPHIGHO2_02_FULL_39_13]|uniref:Fibronectin type-III domain-containing protein n=1 Tax=Candidatus Kuenenbacteria bacterium RIFCSPHIGHO2_02_FULL_39_13 TaxID=1798561 RepID=A0A1F6FLL4_9BACT|nr:MAG: hypothetical protein A3B87_01430 [Candidatus Kuenenbacteria bacterium RIFCSPHIGHO2_02_FULL_39_13]